jgi:hypothetical protein
VDLSFRTETPTRATDLSSAFPMFTSAKTCQSEGEAALELDNKVTPTLGDPLSSALAMSTPVKTCPPHISSGSTCQSEGGAEHERDSTTTPPPTAPWSERESVIKGDIPALPATASLGYAAAVNGRCYSLLSFTTELSHR